MPFRQPGKVRNWSADPELVIFNGETAYEAKMMDGNTIYIGAYGWVP